MPEPLWIGLAAVLATLGFALLALSQERHWHVVTHLPGGPPSPGATARRRALGFALVGLALAACIAGEGAAFGGLLWAVGLPVPAAAVALTLAWRPRWLRPLTRRGTATAPGRPADPQRRP